ncbi:MAG: hypothetical protein ACRBN8_23220 [Nannocystales bacterium]
MRWVVAVGLAVGVVGCVRLNPGFGGETDEGDPATGDASESSTGVAPTSSLDTAGGSTTDFASTTDHGTSSPTPDTDSGPVDPPPVDYPCDADQFDILITPAPDGCSPGPGAANAVTIEAGCMSVRADGPALRGSYATGCGSDACFSTGDEELVFSTEYIHLGNAVDIGNEPVCRFIWAHGFPINGAETCSWESLVIWSEEGELELAVGNGLPDDGFPSVVGRPGGPGVVVSSELLEDAAPCGASQGACARAGWRSFRFAEMVGPALPDGIPAEALLDGQSLSVINTGLQFDLACERFGRWGVVPKGSEWILEP